MRIENIGVNLESQDIDDVVKILMDDQTVYQAWTDCGVGPREDWVRRVVKEYLEKGINVYA